jgi:hypothetical protein
VGGWVRGRLLRPEGARERLAGGSGDAGRLGGSAAAGADCSMAHGRALWAAQPVQQLPVCRVLAPSGPQGGCAG